jgi:hypothetical protein
VGLSRPSPWPFAVTGRAFVVFPGLAPPTDRSRFAEALVNSTSPSKRSRDGGNRLAPTPPLLGFAKCALSPTCLPRVHSREPKPPSARWVPAIRSSSALVVPPHLDGFLRAEVAGLLHPAAGQGFVAFHAHLGPKPEAVRRRSGARDPTSGAPRDAVHTLRSLPFADSRAASLRSLPSLPLPSRRSGPTIRLGDAPIRRSGPPRHRARGAFTPPKRRGTAAHDPRRSKSHRSATWTGRSDQGRGGSTPSAPPRPESERPKTPSLVHRDRSRGAWRGAASRTPKWAGCGSVESSQSGSASRPCSVDEVRCRQATVADDRRSFLPWALFPFEVHRAAVAFQRCLAGDLRGRSLEGRTRDAQRASASGAADQRDPSAGSPAAQGRSPSSRRHGGGRSPATDRRLFSAAVVAPVSRPRG